MRLETLKQILSSRKIKSKANTYEIPEKELVSMLIGLNQVTTLPGISRITIGDEYLMIETRKGTSTYLDYELVRAISFESKEIADRQAGFV